MKNTKEITTGAMLLAIYGAVLLMDRFLSYFFIDIIPLVETIAIIIYGNKYGVKNGAFASVAFFIVSFVLTPDPRFLLFSLIGIIAANLSNILIKKEVNSFTLLLSIMIVFSIGELLDVLVLSSIVYGQSFYQMTISTMSVFKEFIQSLNGRFPQEVIALFSSTILNEQTIGTLLIIVRIIIGIMEGVLVYILSVILFYRFKISTKLNFKHILSLKPITSYILFLIACLFIVNNYYFHPIISPIISGVSSIAFFVLVYYGYIYLLVFFKSRFNMGPIILILLIVLTMPLSLIILFIVGFLYGAGPLKKYLIVERKTNE